jgi:hypothetical protein
MKFIPSGEKLTILLEGAEIFFGFRREIVLSRENIESIEWHADYSFGERIWRTGGADIPNVLYAGYFRGDGIKYYLYLRSPKGVTWSSSPVVTTNTLVIKTSGHQFDQILLTVPRDEADVVIKWWQSQFARTDT